MDDFREKCLKWGIESFFANTLLAARGKICSWTPPPRSRNYDRGSSNSTLSTTREIYIGALAIREIATVSFLGINVFQRVVALLRLLLSSPALQPSPPSIFWGPYGSRRSETTDERPSGHQTWTPSADSSETCVCSMADRCACGRRTKYPSRIHRLMILIL